MNRLANVVNASSSGVSAHNRLKVIFDLQEFYKFNFLVDVVARDTTDGVDSQSGDGSCSGLLRLLDLSA